MQYCTSAMDCCTSKARAEPPFLNGFLDSHCVTLWRSPRFAEFFCSILGVKLRLLQITAAWTTRWDRSLFVPAHPVRPKYSNQCMKIPRTRWVHPSSLYSIHPHVALSSIYFELVGIMKTEANPLPTTNADLSELASMKAASHSALSQAAIPAPTSLTQHLRRLISHLSYASFAITCCLWGESSRSQAFALMGEPPSL